tara:strand:- start:1968 stop:2267 length:300 start_codon:yes stop_codon:yes gene_type:complete
VIRDFQLENFVKNENEIKNKGVIMLAKGETISYVFSVDAEDTPTGKRTLAIDCIVTERKINPVDSKTWAVLTFKSGKSVKRPEDEIVTLDAFDEWEDAE